MPPYLYVENQQVEELPTAYTAGNKMEKGYSGPFWREGKMSPSFDFHHNKIQQIYIEYRYHYLAY